MTHVTQEPMEIRGWTIISWNHENVSINICSIIFHPREADDHSFRGLIEKCQQNQKTVHKCSLSLKADKPFLYK